MRSSRRVLGAAAGGLLLLLTACSGSDGQAASSAPASAPASAAAGEGQAQTLLDAQQLTSLDQQLAYPTKGLAQVTSQIVTLEPGQETGWHKNKVPLYVYVLDGTLTVEYDAGVTKEYASGTAFLDAKGVWHNGTNKGDQQVRMLTVYMGAKGVKNSVQRPG